DASTAGAGAAGNVTLQGNAFGDNGGSDLNDLAGLTATGATVSLQDVEINGVNTAMGIQVTGTTGITLDGAYMVLTAAGADDGIVFNGPVTLATNTTVSSATLNNDVITFNGTVNSAASAGRTLNVLNGSAVAFNDAIGAAANGALGSLTVNNGAEIGTISLADIGGAAAGVTGATAVGNAATAAINFNGTTYNANQQTYTAVAGNNLVMNGGAPTTFTSTADAVAFNTATVSLANGSNLAVNTAGGAISALAGIVGTSDETVTLDAGASTVAVGQIGTSTVALDIGTVTITGNAGVTLGGNISTNNADVSITGPVTLGANIVIDTIESNTDGDVSFSSTIDADLAANNRTLAINVSGPTAVTFGGSIGATQALADLDVSGTTINLNGASVVVDAGAGGATATFTGAVVLGNNVTIDTDGTNDNNVTFTSTINADD
ncbi:MAG: hypothetical protein Q8M66_07785, partial [Actinomycetota bacterium]|nr:hypothetical protein [Actinomycetota bacterium]